MQEIFLYTIIGVIGVLLGWKFREIYANYIMLKLVNKMIAAEMDNLKNRIIDVKIEVDKGEFFVYRIDDGSYIAHAQTKNSLEKILNEKFPDKIFNATAKDLRKLEV